LQFCGIRGVEVAVVGAQGKIKYLRF